MNRDRTVSRPGRSIGDGPLVVAWILGVLILTTAIALGTVQHPGTFEVTSENPTPYGYTWSLSFFVVPIVAIAGWLERHHRREVPRTAYWLTIVGLAPLGFLLDVFFGLLFFNFQNHAATTGINLWALDWSQGRFVQSLPIEEFGFYLFGFMAILSCYVWLDEQFLRLYNRTDYAERARELPRVVRFHWPSLAIGAGLIALALVAKAVGPHPSGFPGWMIFLIVIGLTPATGFYKTAAPFVNWRAFAITCLLMVLVSVIWEVTLAMPYRWWGYNDEQMLGYFVGAWWRLPVEQPFLWVLVSYTTVIVYETLKIVVHMRREGRTVRGAMLGGRP